MQHPLPTAEQREPTAQELAQGVKDIVAAFPSIHLHVAEMTLKVGLHAHNQHTVQKCCRVMLMHVML